jgi:acrylyl-CoA reductase (NADPH)
MSFRAILLEQADDKVSASVTALDDSRLPEGDVTVDVHYSTLNYKDGLILNGLARLVRDYPHVPGIDFSGVVADSSNPNFKAGDEVILTGWGVGERHWGGHAERARVKGDWLVKKPSALSLKQAMAVGTAGFTAMLCVQAIEDFGVKSGGSVLVTGAAGGVGSVAVAVLAKLGYAVTAVTGRPETHDYLKGLGAADFIDRADMSEKGKPLDKSRWDGAVDATGGPLLANTLAQLQYGAPVAACGNAGGVELETTVLPFILRGVALLGIDSVYCPAAPRQAAWDRIAKDLPLDKLDAMIEEHPLGDLPDLGKKILKGQVRGRTVVDVRA